MPRVKITKLQQIILAGGLILAALAFGRLAPANPVGAWLMVSAALVAGIPIIRRAVGALRYRIVGIDALVSIAVVGAVLIGEFWEAAAVTFLFAFGDFLESRTIEKTRSSIKALLELAPATARVLRGGEELLVPSEDVVKDDLVLVKPGEKIAVDGPIVEGYGSVNQAAITGEPLPVEAQTGGAVFSGSILESGYLVIRAQKVGEETSFARILHLVEEAQDKKARTQKFLERFSRYYTPAIILLAVIVFVATRDIRLALTLLVISCPGALVVSVPVSIVAGIGVGARKGILIKGGEILEALGAVKAVAFDKTGTLTEGNPRVVEVVPLAGIAEAEIVRLAAVGEAYSEHPLGAAVLDYAHDRYGYRDLAKPKESQLIPGQGIRFELESTQYLLGNRRLFAEKGLEIDGRVEAALTEQEAKGRTAVLLGTPKNVLGVVAIADTLRDGTDQLSSALRALGVKHVAMLTGDNGRTARAIAAGLGLDAVHHDLLPEDKVRVLQEIREKHGRTAMVGDGVNDAPALATADLGIALGGVGSDIAMETADLVLLSSQIELLPRAISLSRATLRVMKQNIVFSLLVAALLLVGVLVKSVNLSFGMLVHEVSVLLVLLNALRLVRFRGFLPKRRRGSLNRAKAAETARAA